MWWARMSRLPILICGNCQRHENYQGSKSCQRDDGTWYFALGYVLILSKQEHLHSPCGTEHHSVDCISDLSQCGGFPGWPTCGSFLRADLPPTAPPPPPQPTLWPPHHRLHLRAQCSHYLHSSSAPRNDRALLKNDFPSSTGLRFPAVRSQFYASISSQFWMFCFFFQP